MQSTTYLKNKFYVKFIYSNSYKKHQLSYVIKFSRKLNRIVLKHKSQHFFPKIDPK